MLKLRSHESVNERIRKQTKAEPLGFHTPAAVCTRIYINRIVKKNLIFFSARFSRKYPGNSECEGAIHCGGRVCKFPFLAFFFSFFFFPFFCERYARSAGQSRMRRYSRNAGSHFRAYTVYSARLCTSLCVSLCIPIFKGNRIMELPISVRAKHLFPGCTIYVIISGMTCR